MHNKFSHWSGVGVGPTSACHPDRRTTPLTDAQQQGGVATGRREEWEEPAEAGPRGGAAREVERLRRERERVMAWVRAEAGPPQLTVELAEARLHHGLGETDALLRLLSPAAWEEAEPAGATPTGQQHYHR